MVAFTSGATAEEIAQQYPSVILADVYASLTCYLRHRDDVESSLDQRRTQHEQARAGAHRGLDPHGIRERLTSRRSPV